MKPWIVLGGGGHASVIIDTLQALGGTVIGFTDPVSAQREILSVQRLGGDDVVEGYDWTEVLLANGIGSIASTMRRAELFRQYLSKGYSFPRIIHPSAVVAKSVRIGAGTQIMAGAVIQPNCVVGENVIVNTRASLDHDCVIESNTHIAPGVTLSGEVVVGRGAHVGVGATVLQGRRIGAGSIVGAGALVVEDVGPETTVVGVPARIRDR